MYIFFLLFTQNIILLVSENVFCRILHWSKLTITTPLQAHCYNIIILYKKLYVFGFFYYAIFDQNILQNTTCTWLQYNFLWQNFISCTTKCIT